MHRKAQPAGQCINNACEPVSANPGCRLGIQSLSGFLILMGCYGANHAPEMYVNRQETAERKTKTRDVRCNKNRRKNADDGRYIQINISRT